MRARAVPGPRRARLLVPEGGDGPARHAVRARAEGARLRDRHAPSLPGDVRVLARGRAAVRHDDRGLRGPVAESSDHGERSGRAKPDLYLAIAKVAPLVTRARRSRRVDHRHPPRPVADARGRAQARLGRAARALEGEPARRLDRRDVLGRTSASASCRTTRCTTAGTPRSATRIRRSRARAARAAGPAPTRPSAASTLSVRRRRGSRRERLRPLVHRALRGGQDDGREHRRGRARAARARSSSISTATSCARTCRRGSASRRRTATRTSRASAGSHRASRAPAPRSSSPRSPRTRRRAVTRRALVEDARAVHRGLRRDPARGVRAPRPEGPLRRGVRGRDRRLHRRLRSVRGAEQPGDHARHDRGRARASPPLPCSSASRS